MRIDEVREIAQALLSAFSLLVTPLLEHHVLGSLAHPRRNGRGNLPQLPIDLVDGFEKFKVKASFAVALQFAREIYINQEVVHSVLKLLDTRLEETESLAASLLPHIVLVVV